MTRTAYSTGDISGRSRLRPLSPFFAARFKEALGATPVKAVAITCGLSDTGVYHYLQGRVPDTRILFRIARYFGRPMEWFLDEGEVEHVRPREDSVRSGPA